jgi:hypothetical protein
MERFQVMLRVTLLGVAIAVADSATAAVTAEEAARLKTTLTPLGGEKAGNKDGSIPAWTGGYTTPIPGDKPGGRRGDPFKDEKPLFSIDSKNADRYADKLTDGVKALLKKYPESYRVDVYRTHRTAAAPQWMYDNTLKNATRAKLNGDVPEGAYGGTPFPIPKTGAEVIWNHLLRWRGASYQWTATQYLLTAAGQPVMTTDGIFDFQMPYYFQDNPEQFAETGDFWLVRITNVGPPIRTGEGVVSRANVRSGNDQSWVYQTGVHRVRMLPNQCCDTPTNSTNGVLFFDEIETWNGRIDQFDWKLVGKQEMYIPYNNNRLLQPKTDAEVMSKHFLNPDYVRWELHRVWVVDASLRQGQRHQVHRSRYYCDEDTWICVLGDRWDENNQLWRTVWSQTFVAPDMPGTVIFAMGFTDLLSGAAFVGNLFNGKATQIKLMPRYPDRVFTRDALAGEGVR